MRRAIADGARRRNPARRRIEIRDRIAGRHAAEFICQKHRQRQVVNDLEIFRVRYRHGHGDAVGDGVTRAQAWRQQISGLAVDCVNLFVDFWAGQHMACYRVVSFTFIVRRGASRVITVMRIENTTINLDLVAQGIQSVHACIPQSAGDVKVAEFFLNHSVVFDGDGGAGLKWGSTRNWRVIGTIILVIICAFEDAVGGRINELQFFGNIKVQMGGAVVLA